MSVSVFQNLPLFAVIRILTGENCFKSNPIEGSNASLSLTMKISQLSSIHACKIKYMLPSALVNHDQNAQNLQDYITQGLLPLSLILVGISLLRPLQAANYNNLA